MSFMVDIRIDIRTKGMLKISAALYNLLALL